MTNPIRTTNLGVMVEYTPTSYKRTTNLGVMAEYTLVPNTRTSNVGLGVEYSPTTYVRTSNVGLGVEYDPHWHLRTSNIGQMVEYCEFLKIYNALAVWPNGDVYIAGRFNNIGLVECKNAAMWDGLVWRALGKGLFGSACYEREALAVHVHPNGDVYYGGRFHTAGGDPSFHLASWDGSSWHHLGANWGLNGDVYAIEIKPDGTEMYFGGDFTDEWGDPGSNLTRVCSYNVATEVFTSMGDGLGNTVLALKMSPSGVLYAAGEFVVSGLRTVKYIAMWDGTSWMPLGVSYLDDWAATIEFDSKGTLIVGGNFQNIGELNVRGFAYWNGSNWLRPDILFPPQHKDTVAGPDAGCPDIITYLNTNVYALEIGEDDDLFVGGESLSTIPGGTPGPIASDYSGITYINNTGTTEVKPVIYIKGSGKLRYIENETNKSKVYFDLIILADEEIFIDFEAKTILSTVRNDLQSGILSGSDFGQFSLTPGENKLAVFISGGVGNTVQIRYAPIHWSADSTRANEGY
jgi:hypothetical protein